MSIVLLIHELFHAFVAFLFGFHTEKIELYPFGGAAEIRGISDDYILDAIVAAAGPLISLFIGFLWEQGAINNILPQSDDFVRFSYFMGDMGDII